jgi:hypothetical protein
VLAAEDREPAQLVDRDEPGADPVVHVVVVVGDRIGEVGELRLERGLASLEEALSQLAEAACVGGRAVLEDALAGLEGQVEPGELRVALLELVHHPQRLQVVLEAAELAHALVERVLAGVAEGRMAEVVGEADGLGERLVQSQRAGHAARNLRDLERVRQPRAVQVALVVDEDLGLVHEAAEGRGVHDPVAVALILRAVPRRRFREAPPARGALVLGVGREAGIGAHAASPKWTARVASRASAG